MKSSIFHLPVRYIGHCHGFYPSRHNVRFYKPEKTYTTNIPNNLVYQESYMTIQMLHSPLKMMTSNSLSEHEPYKKNVRMQVAQAWQNKNLPTGGKVGDSQDKPEQSQVNQAMI